MKAWEVLEKYGWTQRAFARNKYEEEVSEHSNLAVSFCALGAISKIYNNNFPLEMEVCRKLRIRLELEPTTRSITDWNDKAKSKEEIIKVLKELDI